MTRRRPVEPDHAAARAPAPRRSRRRPVALGVTALLSTVLAVAAGLATASPAAALTVVGHGVGYTWAADGRSWIGSHRLGDGNLGLCVQILSAPPEGIDVVYKRADTLDWYGATESARLAYIARTWANSTDPKWAAAAQLATWTITGLNGHDDGWYAQRANGEGASVLALARSMRQQIDGPEGASRGAAAKLSLVVPSDAGGTVTSQLVVNYIGAGKTQLPPGRFTGRMTLTGAVFEGGSSSRTVSNGETFAITPALGTALTDVTANVVYENLPFGDDVYVAKAPPGRQSLLVPPPGGITAQASAHAGDVSPLPFQPAVRTQSSTTRAEVGGHLFDRLELGLRPKPRFAEESQNAVVAGSDADAAAAETEPELTAETLDEWGLYRDEHGALQPVPVTIHSTLWGPFETPPSSAPTAPAHAPIVCTVTVHAEDGPGSYKTPDCILPEAGYYVWTETIDPADTPPDKGGERFTAWASPFGTASEVTLAVSPPPITPTPTPPPTVPPAPTPPPGPTPTVPPTPIEPPAPSTTPMPPTGAHTPPPTGPRALAETGLALGTIPAGIGIGAAVAGVAALLTLRLRGGSASPSHRMRAGARRTRRHRS